MNKFKYHVNKLPYFFMLIFVSLAVFKILMQIHAPHFKSLSDAAYGVIIGKPHWIAYQNRLLGPYIVHFISQGIGSSYYFSLKMFIFIMILVQNIILFTLLIKMKMEYRQSLVFIVLFSFVFIMIQHRWYYTWDSIDLIIFTLFAWGIFQGKSVSYYIILFFVAILNRESALFITIFIIIDAFKVDLVKNKFFPKMRIHLESMFKLSIGLILLISGIVYSKLVRDYLFISQPDGYRDTAHELIGNHIYFFVNVSNLFYYNVKSMEIINSVFIIASITYLLVYSLYYRDSQFKALFVFMIIIANILVFGLINETRMYILLIPFILFFHIEIEKIKQTVTAR